ncbi:unnamed protein product [Lasius platythorax]|uniref:Uncharacterized protein n=1 Tax=Lasius platythorax TaxID=488582 RepID=A0AAV2NYU5_9HYME
MLTPISKITKKAKRQNQSSELQDVLLEALKMPEMDAMCDGFLKIIGEGLRKLSYQKRVLIEIKFLQMIVEHKKKYSKEK